MLLISPFVNLSVCKVRFWLETSCVFLPILSDPRPAAVMAIVSFRRCRDSTCTQPKVPSIDEVKEILLPRMFRPDAVILGYTRIEQVYVPDLDCKALLLFCDAPENLRKIARPDRISASHHFF